jgi:hypothetical protein
MKTNSKENLKNVCGDTLTSGSVRGSSVQNSTGKSSAIGAAESVQPCNISAGENGGKFAHQTGSSLVIALAFITILFVITAAAIRYSISSAKSGDAVSIKADEDWRARELSAYSTGWITEKLPKVFQRELQAAKQVCGGVNLPAFNPESSGSAACENSLLGDFQEWLSSKIPAIEQFGKDQIKQGETATVGAVLQDGGRVETGKTEPSYLVNFQVDTSAGDAGSQSKQGQVFLASAWYACTAEATLREDTTIAAGQTAVLSGEYFNASKLELLENSNKIWQLATIDRRAAQSYSVTVSPVATSSYVVLAYSAVESGCVSGSSSVVVTVGADPMPTPTPTATPTPAVDPTPFVTPTPEVSPTPTTTPTPFEIFPTPTPTPTATPTPELFPTPTPTPTPPVVVVPRKSVQRELAQNGGVFSCRSGNEFRVANGFQAIPCTNYTVDLTVTIQREAGGTYLITASKNSNADTSSDLRARGFAPDIGLFGSNPYGFACSGLEPTMCYEGRTSLGYWTPYQGGAANTGNIVAINYSAANTTATWRIVNVPSGLEKIVFRDAGGGVGVYRIYFAGYDFGPGDRQSAGDLTYDYVGNCCGGGGVVVPFDVP